MNVEYLGYLAATLTTAAFVPQAWLTWKQKKAEGVSKAMYLIFITGLCCWLGYGLMINSGPIIVSNIITIALAGFILAMKLKYG
jgi:MtN3 and saliva related transmembrane protein